jgi:hypothetical protein
MSGIDDLEKLSLNNTLKLFKLKFMPVFTHGLDLIRTYLTAMSLKNLENLKAIYLKKIMRLSNFTPSRLIYALAMEPYLLEDLRQKMLILSMTANKTVMVERQGKAREI